VLVRSEPEPGVFCVDAALKAALLDLLANPGDDGAFSLRTDEIESVSLKRGGERIELRRSERGFELGLAPSTTPVELETGNRWLDALVGVRGRRIPDAGLKTLGLEPPAGSITLRSSTVEHSPKFEETVLLGAPQADGSLPISRRYDGVVLSLAPEAARALSSDASPLRGRRLLDFGPSELRSLTVITSGERERLRRTESGVFELVEPRGFSHDAGLVLDLVQALGTLEADRWVSGHEDASFGFAKPLARVEAELTRTAEPARFRLDVGAETSGGYFAKLDTTPGVFVLPRAFVHDLTTPLLARDVFVVDPARLAGITLRIEQRRFELVRGDGGFRAAAGSAELSPALVERLVAAVTSLRAEAALHTGPARPAEGLAQPEIELGLRVAIPRDELISVRIGAESSFRGSPIRFARRSGVDATYGIPAASIREIREAL
jgi:hypothetical protein